MRKILSIFAAMLFVGSMMATDVSVVIADYATANSWVNATQYLTVKLDENVTATVTGGGNSGKYYTKGNEWRIYQTENPTLKIATTSGTLSSIKVTYNVTNTGTLKDGETNIASATSVAVSGTEKTFSVGNTESATTNGQVKITKIEVSYSAGAPASVATPTFTPAPGTYHSAQNVTIACATEGAEIHYTLDGTEPLSTDKKYTEPIVLGVDGDYTIKAIAIKGDDKSAVATADYTIAFPKSYSFFDDLVADASAVGKLVSVTFANIKLTGVYVNSQEKFHGVYINAQDNDDNDLEIYCKLVEVPAAWGLGGTISGTIVGTWKEYNGQWEVEIDDWSGVTTYVAPAVEAPRMTPLSESFFSELDVTLTCATDGAKIYYTLDKSAPTAESAEYTAPIKLNASTAIRAIAIKGEDKSEIAYKQYSKAEVMTVEAAFDALGKSTPINNVYVAGIVSKVDSYNSTYGSITYWISDDGKTEGNQLQVYGGLGLEGKKFTKKEDLKVGDKVTIYGNLKIYSGTKEFDLNNILVEYESGVATAIENEAVETKAVKYFENGQLIIEKNGVKYNAQGAIVK